MQNTKHAPLNKVLRRIILIFMTTSRIKALYIHWCISRDSYINSGTYADIVRIMQNITNELSYADLFKVDQITLVSICVSHW